ncbi:efflux transporter outer membrane subunit [Hydrocarboniphaga sp.]|uniref:efflux transporter outer membrane subunit n=1 Tax=Hydrocarboniphaga sp. TaxID=2033016 RepID=UPI003D0DC3F9
MVGESSKRAIRVTTFVLATMLVAAGCALQPAYRAPQPESVGPWQADRPHDGSASELVDWWKRFNDPAVAELIQAAEADSPTLTQAAAAIRSARATLASNEAGLWPSVDASASLTRSKVSDAATQDSVISTSRSGGLDASWEIDLFGKLRNGRSAARASVEASIDSWHDARVSLAAEVADDYVQYRACRQLQAAYEAQTTSQQQTAQSTRLSAAAGLSARTDAYLADASAASAASTATAQRASCERLVKSLVEVTGMDEARLRTMLDRAGAPALPEPAQFTVDSVPADLVRQRPDLSSTERTLAADYAQIAVALADRYPSFSLSGSISVSASNLASPTTGWSFGPSLSVPLFDAGKRRAAVDSAAATYEQQLARHRGAVRAAVREVEQALVDLDGAAQRSGDARTAAEQYRRYASAVEGNWRAGFDSLLTVEVARRSAISAEVSLIELQRDRVRYWIALYKALGGGWHSDRAAVETAPAGQAASQGAKS